MLHGSQLMAAPPMIIQVMIKMFKMEKLQPEWVLYAGQDEFQFSLLLICLVCVPVLLMGKPYYIKRQMDAEYAAVHGDNPDYQSLDEGEQEGIQEESHDHNFGDVCVHQGIHTIEFILGCVSNTASYLRLWALSLAHSQLSEVFWEYILSGYHFSLFGQNPGMAGGVKTLIPCYLVFFVSTIGILMGMESLSAFLHALRLQWVEFQTKFYAADGEIFRPLSFEDDPD